MFGFPVNLQDSGVQKFTNDADSGFPKIQQREVFYSVRDGQWDDPLTWQTASGRVGKFPTRFDDVYIKHRVINDLGFDALIEVNNLFIFGRLEYGTNGGLFYARKFYVYGNIQCTGILDLTNQRTGASDSHTFRLYGYNNRIDNFIPSNGNGFVDYYSTNFIPQPVLNLPYSNVSFNGPGIKYLTGNLSTTGDLLIRTFGSDTTYDNTLDLRVWNLNVGGNLGVGKIYWDLGYGKGSLIRTGGAGGNVVIGGLCSVNGYMDLSGCDIEFKNGLTYSSQNSLSNIVNASTDTWRFTTTASQNMAIGNTLSGQLTINAQIIVGSGVTLNLTRGYAGPVWRFNNSINGVDGTSKLVNQCEVLFQTSIAASNIMQTGIADFSTFANTSSFYGDYSATISNKITTFHNVTISGTGTKSLGINTTLNGNLATFGVLECSTFDLLINGTTNIQNDGATLSKTGGGNVLFGGLVTFQYVNTFSKLDLSGNPNVEMRGGMTLSNANHTFISGTGLWTFTTNNQTIQRTATPFSGLRFDCNILISGAITLTLYENAQGFLMYGTFNGNNAASTLQNRGRLYYYNSGTQMAVGVFDKATWAGNIVGYFFNGNFTLPYTTYEGLAIAGTGTKTLLGNTTTNSLINLYGNLELSTFNFTNNGTTNVFDGGSLTKSGAGNVLFVGQINMPYSLGVQTIDFSIGNPNVEVRGGIIIGNGSNTLIKSGSSVWSFTTNNQNFFIQGIYYTYDFEILISGAITLTIQGSTTLQKSINGNNINSKLLINANSTIQYNSATQPMATGILDTSTNANTWIYGNANQDIKGGPTTLAKQVYRNLTLNGGGTKTLQGFVSVLNTYTLTSPATLANNGFTLTNP
jgi:hypothetical protein